MGVHPSENGPSHGADGAGGGFLRRLRRLRVRRSGRLPGGGGVPGRAIPVIFRLFRRAIRFRTGCPQWPAPSPSAAAGFPGTPTAVHLLRADWPGGVHVVRVNRSGPLARPRSDGPDRSAWPGAAEVQGEAGPRDAPRDGFSTRLSGGVAGAALQRSLRTRRLRGTRRLRHLDRDSLPESLQTSRSTSPCTRSGPFIFRRS